jgi:alkanesulfonate monooxygenase SsuD/methylene tetrahydromethanopterin reductase-like flavin-dependent oxidoreductase (luciferase family)
MPEPNRQPALGFALRDPYPWRDLAALAAAGERAGFRTLFLPEVGARDTLATLAALAGDTDRLTLGTGVVPLPSRSPALLAAAAATVQERSGGRLLLGLGTGPSRPGALDRLRSTVEALHTAFIGGEGHVDGMTIHAGLRLPVAPPIWLAALGPNATRLAGEIADGVLLNWCTPERVALATEQIAEGAARAGRDPHDVTVGVYVRAALAPGSAAAARAAAAEYASYPAYRRQFVAMGIDPTDPDAVVAGVILTDAATARDRLNAYRAAGADLPVVYPIVRHGPPSAEAARITLQAVAPDPW